jgi:hypothetical protein
VNRILTCGCVVMMIFLFATCKESYEPPVIAGDGSYLVVEGAIILNAPTTIKLSRTSRLKDTSKVLPESYASISIEDEANGKYPLSETTPGTYTLPVSGLSAGKKYRLRIKTSSSSEYLSDYVQALETPEIDSINFKMRNNGIQFYANTHDTKNNTRYYRWDYDETWKYSSAHFSSFQYNGSKVEFRPESKLIFNCYRSALSNTINLGSSANLTNDVITDGPVVYIPASSGKLSYGYNILVRQYALTEEAYLYWQNLKKNTEQLGTIFDAQPSIASGNIHCVTNPEELVIGYLSSSSVSSRRFHFENQDRSFQLPSYVGPPSMGACSQEELLLNASYESRAKELFSSGRYIPTTSITDEMGFTIGYYYAPDECVDCRVKGGTTVKPSYWP